MSFVAISDVHIKNPGDRSQKLFFKFLDSDPVKNSKEIYLLGDIFDLLVGGHKEYLEKFHDVFQRLAQEIKSGKRIFQFEGNHDFHFEKLISLIKKKYDLPDGSWEYFTEPQVKEYGESKILFAHGDEIEVENPNYQKYRNIIRSRPIYILANYIVPFNIVDKIGRNASEKSRMHNDSKYNNDESNNLVRERFRRTFLTAKQSYKVDMVICGHSHCKDLYEIDDKIYSNNGFFPATQTFTFYHEKKLSHQTL